MLTIVALLCLLLILPFVAAIVGVGLLAATILGGILCMPFVWLYSAFQTNS